jgi:hypothetical protein
MQAYKFDIKISEVGTISLPHFLPDLYGREVELFIVPKKEKSEKIEQASAKKFVSRWAGFLKDMNIDPEKPNTNIYWKNTDEKRIDKQRFKFWGYK